jgi:PKD repeat protein
VDCWGKYLDVDKILISRVLPSDPQYSEYEVIVNYFSNQTSGYGNNYQVYRVDSPDHQPYTNSFILNKRVFVPIMGSPDDADAVLDYETAMPGYEVIGISGNWVSTDAVHCRVMGIADRGMLYIKHSPLLGEKPQEPQYDITADIIPYSGMSLVSDSVKIYYQVDGGTLYSVNMSHATGDTYTGSIPGQTPGSEIAYYLHAADTSGRTSEHPLIGAPDPHLFTVSLPLQPPDAEFTADNTSISEGQSIQFTDQSTNNPTQWSWSFPGGTPSGSTVQHPIVTYDTQGTYPVTLTASNSAGSDTETKVDYITVLPAGFCLGEIINPGFETGSFSGWTETGSVSITSTARTGSYGVSLDAGGSKVEQVISGLCPNNTYIVSSWGIAKANAGVYLGIKDYGGSEQTVQFTDSKNWQQKSITFTTGASNTSVTIFFTKTSTSRFTGTGDDFELVIVN